MEERWNMIKHYLDKAAETEIDRIQNKRPNNYFYNEFFIQRIKKWNTTRLK